MKKEKSEDLLEIRVRVLYEKPEPFVYVCNAETLKTKFSSDQLCMIFGIGADIVNLKSSTYKKISDVADFDHGLMTFYPQRVLIYRRQEKQEKE